MKIHKEGYCIIATTVVCCTLASCGLYFLTPWAGYAAGVFSLLFIAFVLRFFRVPNRIMPQLSNDVVYSSCDGTVVEIEEVFEPEFLQEKVLKVAIFMSVWNVHINWFPVSGTVTYFKHHPGKYLVAWAPKSSEVNERTTTVVESARGRVLFRQIAGFLARRIVNRTAEKDTAVQCQECGFIKFGSRMDIFMPLGSEVCVKIGERVTGTQTIIAHLPKQ